MLQDALAFLSAQGDDPAAIRVLVPQSFARHFRRSVVLENGTAIEEATDDDARPAADKDIDMVGLAS